jgi:hypothetical protein
MYNCSEDLSAYHDEKVNIGANVRKQMREHRDANRNRLKRGLQSQGRDHPNRFIIQGSYRMKTMVQHSENDYDIDDGASFAPEKLTNQSGQAMTPREAKNLVRDALLGGGGLPGDPETLDNCVRVKYAEGHHVDIPVYRETAGTDTTFEIASTEWRPTSPEEITEWFESEEERAHVSQDEEPQLRRMVRFLKRYSRNHLSDDSLSGLLLTILAAEKYAGHDAREDRAFRNLLSAVKARLEENTEIKNPAGNSTEVLTKPSDANKTVKLIGQIGKTLEALDVLDDPSCSKRRAREAWDEAFNTDFFGNLGDDDDDDNGDRAPYTPSPTEPSKKVHIRGPGTAA